MVTLSFVKCFKFEYNLRFLIRVQANNIVYIKKNIGIYEKEVIYLFRFIEKATRKS